MSKQGKMEKPPGSFFDNHGRWAWKVKLPGESSRQTIKLCPPGQSLPLKVQGNNEQDAWRIAWKIWRGHSGDAGDTPTVAGLCKSYIDHAKTYYRESRESIDIEIGLRRFVSNYGQYSVDAITPIELSTLQTEMIAVGLTRLTINKYIGYIQRMYRWALPQGKIDAYTEAGIARFPKLKHGRSDAVENKPVQPVEIEAVRATMAELPQVLCDMILVQWICNMRPGEVCRLRMSDIDTSDNELWIYEPKHHKNQWRGKLRLIPIFPEARKIIENRAKNRPLDSYIFSPAESVAEWLQKRTANRITPAGQGNKPGANCKGTRRDTEHFTAQTYGRAITRAITRINAARKAHKPPMQDLLPSWSPNQLRHAKATENRAKYGRNIAALLLGHAPGSGATDIYTRQAIKDEEREKAKQELREAVKGLTQE